MKDIISTGDIATLEAKRAAAPADGARRVPGLIVLLVSAFWLAGLGPARAQTVTDPTGRISVTLVSGWELLDHPPSADTIFRAQPAEEYPMASCELTRHVERLPQRQTRERLNAATEGLQHSPMIDNYRRMPGVTIEGVIVVMINGIAVLDIRSRRSTLIGVERRVMLQRPGELEVYTLACGAHPEETEAVDQAFAVARSFQVHD